MTKVLPYSVYLFPVAAICWLLYVLAYWLLPTDVFIEASPLLITSILAKVGNWSFFAGLILWVICKLMKVEVTNFQHKIRFYGLIGSLFFWLLVAGPFILFFLLVTFNGLAV